MESHDREYVCRECADQRLWQYYQGSSGGIVTGNDIRRPHQWIETGYE